MGALNQPTFSGVQANLVQPTINEEYQALTKETIKRLAGKEITVAGMTCYLQTFKVLRYPFYYTIM